MRTVWFRAFSSFHAPGRACGSASPISLRELSQGLLTDLGVGFRVIPRLLLQAAPEARSLFPAARALPARPHLTFLPMFMLLRGASKAEKRGCIL